MQKNHSFVLFAQTEPTLVSHDKANYTVAFVLKMDLFIVLCLYFAQSIYPFLQMCKKKAFFFFLNILVIYFCILTQNCTFRIKGSVPQNLYNYAPYYRGGEYDVLFLHNSELTT